MSVRSRATFYIHEGTSAESMKTCSSIRSFYSCISAPTSTSVPSIVFSTSVGSFEGVALARVSHSAATTIDLYQCRSPSISASSSSESISTREHHPSPASPPPPVGLYLIDSVAEKTSVSQHSLEEIALAGIDLESATTIDLTHLAEGNGKEEEADGQPTEKIPVERAPPRIRTCIARYNDGTKEYRGPDRSPWSPISEQPVLILDITHRQRAPWDVYAGAEVDDIGDLGGPFRGEPEESFFCLINSRLETRLTYDHLPKKRSPLLLYRLHHPYPSYLQPRPVVLPPPGAQQAQPSRGSGKGGFRGRWYDRRMMVNKKVEVGMDTAGDVWWETVEMGYRIGALFRGSKRTDEAGNQGKDKKEDKVERGTSRVKRQQRSDGQQKSTELGRKRGIKGKEVSNSVKDKEETTSAVVGNPRGPKGRFRSKLDKLGRRLRG